MINTTDILALLKGNTLFKILFRRKPLTNFLDYKESTRRAHMALRALGVREGITESSASRENREDREDSFFVNKEAK